MALSVATKIWPLCRPDWWNSDYTEHVLDDMRHLGSFNPLLGKGKGSFCTAVHYRPEELRELPALRAAGARKIAEMHVSFMQQIPARVWRHLIVTSRPDSCLNAQTYQVGITTTEASKGSQKAFDFAEIVQHTDEALSVLKNKTSLEL